MATAVPVTLPPLAPVRLVVLDFDGTFTDSEAEGAPFAAAYPQILAQLAGLAPAELADWSVCLAQTAAESPEYGWVLGDLPAAAPADADPYIRCSMAAHKLLDRLGKLSDLAERGAILSAAYKQAYAHSAVVFRAGAREALDGLLARGIHVVVVTNSDTGHVAGKVDQLQLKHRERVQVYGNAMKFHTGDVEALAQLPQTWQLPGLQRPLYCRRDRYHERLQSLWEQTDTSPAQTLVAGDIFELDLLLPALLGARVHLMERANTYAYERAAVAAFGSRAASSQSLLDLLGRLD